MRDRECCSVHAGTFPNRRAFIAGFACAAVLPALARAQFAPNAADDLRFMRDASTRRGRPTIRSAP